MTQVYIFAKAAQFSQGFSLPTFHGNVVETLWVPAILKIPHIGSSSAEISSISANLF